MRCRCCPSLLCLCLLLLGFTPGAAQLTDALSVRSLSAEQAKEGRAVTLRATVGFIESPGTIFVQDATAGTFLRTKKLLIDLKEGDQVEVHGQTFPGLFLPGVEIGRIEVIGHGDPPLAQPASYDDLAAARFHYQRVSIEGIVRSVAPRDENRSILRLAMGSRVLEVRVDGLPADDSPLVDARVRVTGLAAGTINDRRQMVQPYVRVSSWNGIVIQKPAHSPDEVPVATTASLLHFSATGETGHRVRVEGTVTGAFRDPDLIFVRDGETSIAVQPAARVEVTVGDRITADGFPVMDRFTPTLADARLISVTPDTVPAPVTLRLKDLPKQGHEGDLISVSGVVTDAYRSGDGHVVVIAGDGTRLPARLSSGEPLLADLRSQVALTGICRVESVTGKGFNATPESFTLWLRSTADLRVIKAPSLLSVERLVTALGVLACVIIAALVWIFSLRRQVARQTLALRAGIQHEAALEERQRIAREFHDTLEQELAGLSLRLDAAATRPLDDKARGLLETSRSLVSRVQAEARNLVADLRDDPAAQVELSTALQDIAHRQPANAPEVRVEIDDDLPALPPNVVHHLRMIAQESVTNALKHARARTIILRLRALDKGVEMSVTDDGAGFDPDSQTQGKPGHFGCMGIRERCRKAGAEVQWTSAPGQGTRLEVRYRP